MCIGEEIFEGKPLSHQGLAIHRFNSCSKPMIRTCFTFRPICGECQVIYNTREKKTFEAQSMLKWAHWIDVKHAILLAMMTEGGVECIKVTRLNESEKTAELGD